MEKRTKRGPLLYVSQTFLNTPMKNMQEVFTNRQEVQLPIEEPVIEEESNKKKSFEVSLAKTDLPKETKDKDLKKDQSIQSKQEKPRTFNKVKGFREMNLKERLEYLENFPKALPPVPCVFYTEEKNLQGYLVEYNEQEVTIRFPNQTTETIPFKELKDVMMIGIKR
ncbi:CotO family spore coat protein [Neobacillus niacini]|uniref:CotO family spore coat protein n=1 Tax=Neobacillus niacini TaxID=86668 RepID=UPI003983C3E7